MNSEELRQRTKTFALRVMTLVDHLPRNAKGLVLGTQLLRSATSVGANYRAACRGRSRAVFLSKLSVVLEEADESALWLELIEGEVPPKSRVQPLLDEACELTAIFFSARRTSSARQIQKA